MANPRPAREVKLEKKNVVLLFATMLAVLLTACGGPSQAEVDELVQRVEYLERVAAGVLPEQVLSAPQTVGVPAAKPIEGAEECGIRPVVASVPFGPHATVVQRAGRGEDVYALSFADFDAAVEATLRKAGMPYYNEVWVAAVYTTYVGVNSGPYEVEIVSDDDQPFVVLWPEIMPAEFSDYTADDVYVGPLSGIAIEVITNPEDLPSYVEWASCLVGENNVFMFGTEKIPANVFMDLYDTASFLTTTTSESE